MPTVGIVVLNWNGWRDTIECLESVFRSEEVRFRVIVCDNASHDGSLDQIAAWADGTLAAPALAPFVSSAVTSRLQTIPYVRYDRPAAEAGGELAENAPLVLVQTGANLGFAGGNNVGFRYCLAHGGFDFVWVLNNDTVVDGRALCSLLRRMQADPRIGMCGSKLVFYHRPHLVQAYGGSAFDARLGLVHPIGHLQPAGADSSAQDVEQRLAYVVGASMLVSTVFLREIGLMSEDYFLYYEEIDWAFRARGKFGLGYSPGSVVFHKEGGSIGSSSTGEPSTVSTTYLYRNRVLFNWKFNRPNFARCMARVLFELVVLLKRRQFRTAKAAFLASCAMALRLGRLRARHG